MTVETVSNIEITSADGTLIVKLEGGGKSSYQHVYRAAAGVYWDNDAGAFKFDTKNDKRFAHWFVCIQEVLENEMAVRLHLVSTTTWTNVPDDIQHAIKLAAG